MTAASLASGVLALHSAAAAAPAAAAPEATTSTSVSASSSSRLHYRALQPRDLEELKAAHAALFPIDYDLEFFVRASNGLDRIWSCAAVSTSAAEDAAGSERLIGFITARLVFLHEVDMSDRQHMGLLSGVLDHDRVLYIMTLGVVEGSRHRGIASTLVSIACQHAYETRCRAVFLHVITYNEAAMALYSRQGFSCVAKLCAFYFIATGRTPDPMQQVHDAYLFVHFVGGGAGGVGNPWDLVSLAWSPLRFAFNRIHSCVPGFCRAELSPQQQQQQPQQEHLLDATCDMADGDQHSSSGGSGSGGGTRPHYHQQQDKPGRRHNHQHPYQHHAHYSHHHHHHPHHHQQRQHEEQLRVQPPEQQWHRDMHSHSRRSGSSSSRPGLPGPGVPSRWPAQQQQQQPLLVQQDVQQAAFLQQHTVQQHAMQQQRWEWEPQPAAVSVPQQPPPLQQQHQHQQAQPGEAYALHQGMQPPPQRMLRWLFNGSSRGPTAGAGSAAAVTGRQQPQLLHDAACGVVLVPPPSSAAARHQWHGGVAEQQPAETKQA